MKKWVKDLWFPVAVIVLVGIIAYNLYTVARLRQAAEDQIVASQGSDTRGSGTRTALASGDEKTAPEDLVGQPGPRTVVLRLKPKNEGAQLDAEKLAGVLRTIGPVEDASVEADTVKLTLHNSLRFSELQQQLGFQDVGIADEESSLEGDLRLHVSGMT